MSEAILFRKCLGFTDLKGIATQTMIASPRAKGAGSVELIDCLNLTTTADGCIEKIAPLVTALDTGAAITNLSAQSRLMFSDGTNVKEWTGGSTIVNRFPAINGPIAHTLLDVRVASNGSVYKSVNSAPAMQQALVGTYTGPPVSKSFSAMPAFTSAFVYNAKLYAISAADPRFLVYSEDYGYDLYNLADNFIGSYMPCLQAAQIPGVLLKASQGGITAYVGMGPNGEGFHKRFYPCKSINGTLFSGMIPQITGASDGTPTTIYVYQHVFLCDDGLYTVNQDGVVNNITDQRIDNIGSLNSSYSCATVQNGKYLAFGNNCCIEYDFNTKAVMKRATFGIGGACVWNKDHYFSTGNRIVTQGADSDTTSAFGCSFTLPYSDLSVPGVKSVEALYFTGTMDGDLIITATDQNGESWQHEVSGELLKVTNYRIKTPRRRLGNNVSFSFECNGAFRLEELRAVLSGSNRSR